MHGPRAAEADEHEVARVVAALDGDEAERVHHRRVRDLDDPVRGLDDVEAERLGAALLDRARARPRRRGAISPPRKYVRVEPPEHEVRVGDGRLGAAAPVADRARGRRRRCAARRAARRRSRPRRSSRRPRRSRRGRSPACGSGSRTATARRCPPPACAADRRSPSSPAASRPGSGRPSRSCRPCRTR